MRAPALTTLAAIALVFGTVSSAAAEPPSPLQDQIDSILLEHPGGTQTGSDSISWDDGATVLTLVSGAARGFAPLSVGSCATGYYCAYSGTSLTGSRISFSACGTTVSTSGLPGVVRSLANARSSGSIQALNSSSSVLATVGAGGQNNFAPTGIAQLQC